MEIEKEYCLSSFTYIECLQSILLMIILLISFIILSYGVIQTYRSYFQKGFKFEQFILLNGVIIILLQILLIFFKNLFLIHLIHFLNLFIVVYITKRFIRAFCLVKHMDINYERFFLVFNIINCFFLVVNIVITTLDCFVRLTIYDLYYIVLIFIYLHKVFAIIVTYIYFKAGLSIIKFLNDSIQTEQNVRMDHVNQNLIDVHNDNDHIDNYHEDCDEVYTKLRM